MAAAVKRLELRCTPEQREIIDRAVRLTGRSVTDFVLEAAQDAAVKTIAEYETIRLSAQDSAALVNALLSPPQPNTRLRAAAKRYKRATSR